MEATSAIINTDNTNAIQSRAAIAHANANGTIAGRPNNNNMNNNDVPVLGQKRDANGFVVHSIGLKSAQDDIVRSTSDGSFVKLFVGYVPKTITEDEVRCVFAEHGNLLEVALVKDKTSGQQKGCCFVKYATVEEAERAIKALHNICILPGGTFPVQVRYADGELDRLGTMEHKLFVGSLNKQATEKEIEEIFVRYGQVESIYLMKDELKQNRGSAFVKYVSREMAMAAIHALNGTYVMEGCNYPLTVRIAEPKRRRVAANGLYAVSNLNSGLHGRTGPRPTLVAGWGIRECSPTNWQPMAAGFRVTSHTVPHPYGNSIMPREGPIEVVLPMIRPIRDQVSDPTRGQMRAPAQMTAPFCHQGFNPVPVQQQIQVYGLQQPQAPAQKQTQSYVQQLPYGQQQLQEPMQMQKSPQAQSSTNLQLQNIQQSLQHGQLQQIMPHYSVSKSQVQQKVAPPLQQAQTSLPQFSVPASLDLQSLSQSQLHTVQFQLPAVQANFQPQQYSFGQQYPSLQQQQQFMQTTAQSLQNQQGHTQQQPWTYMGQPNPSLVTATVPTTVAQPTTATTTVVEGKTSHPSSETCNWSEYTSPEGHKYYYNSVTGESKWEKPVELVPVEKHQKQPPSQAQQPQSHPQLLPQLRQTQFQQTANAMQPPMQFQQTLSHSHILHHQIQHSAIPMHQPQTQVLQSHYHP